MFRYADGSYVPSGRPVSSLSSGSSDGSRNVSGPPSPAAFQLNNYAPPGAAAISTRKKERDSRSMGADFPFPLMQTDVVLGSYHDTPFSNARQTGGKKSPKPDSYKTVMCQAWLESKICTFAENCRFAHGEAELRPSKAVPKQNSKYKTKLCDKYTTTGLCPYGSRCLFIHEGNPSGNNAYIRPDKLVEVTQRHAMADMTAQKSSNAAPRPVTPEMESLFGNSHRAQLRPHPSWPLEPANFFVERNEDDGAGGGQKLIDLFGCFDTTTTPNRVSLASSLSGYASGGSSPFSTVSSSSINLNTSDDEHFERDFFRTTGLEYLAEELTRNLTTTELW